MKQFHWIIVGWAVGLSIPSWTNGAPLWCNPDPLKATADSKITPIYSNSPGALLLPPTTNLREASSQANSVTANPNIVEGIWTEEKIDISKLEDLDHGKDHERDEPEMIGILRKQYGIRVYVTQDDVPPAQAYVKRDPSTASGDSTTTELNIAPENYSPNPKLKDINETSTDGPAVIQYTAAFKDNAYQEDRGMFLQPGGVLEHQNGPMLHEKDPVIFLKSYADRLTILHEFVHFLIYQARQLLGHIDPWTRMGLMKTKLESDAQTIKQRYGANSNQYKSKLIDLWSLSIHRLSLTEGEEMDVQQYLNRISLSSVEKQHTLGEHKEHLKELQKKFRAQLDNPEFKALAQNTASLPQELQRKMASLQRQINNVETKIDLSKQWERNAA